jgi:hypothetical protein
VVKELSAPEVGQAFNKHFTAVGFPHLRHAQQHMDADSDTDSEPDFGMMDNATVDSRVRQDDYQQLTGSGRIGGDSAPFMWSREFDVVNVWPNSRYGVDFNALLRCLPATNVSSVILSSMSLVGNATNGIRHHPHPHVRSLSRHPTTCHHRRFGRDWQSSTSSARSGGCSQTTLQPPPSK